MTDTNVSSLADIIDSRSSCRTSASDGEQIAVDSAPVKATRLTADRYLRGWRSIDRGRRTVMH